MRMNTQHVMQVLDFIRDGEYIALVTQFADGGDLSQHVETVGKGRGLQVVAARDIAVGIATALKELHDHDIVHRDLKPRNVLLIGNVWKLADFGISKNCASVMTQKTFQQYGTLGYAAPEQFQGSDSTANPCTTAHEFCLPTYCRRRKSRSGLSPKPLMMVASERRPLRCCRKNIESVRIHRTISG